MRKLNILFFLLLIYLAGITSSFGQSQVSNFQPLLDDEPSQDWFHLDHETDGIRGVSSMRAYDEILKNKTSQTVIVAVIDSGIEVDHEDLQANIWVNEDEVAGNGLDDDGNGYVDDINGWDFIGGADGEDVNQDTYEMVREIVRLQNKYGNKDGDPNDDEYEYYQSLLKAYDEEYTEYKGYYDELNYAYPFLTQAFKDVMDYTGKEDATLEELKEIPVSELEPQTSQSVQVIMTILSQSPETSSMTVKELQEVFTGEYNQLKDLVEYSLNLEFEPRVIVGDNYEDKTERYYGNAEVEGPDADHGTHVAGIIAAVKGNNLGMDGIATDVKIMVVRTVPNGDERDKDVANAIRYAVDNGAQIINMSFGKGYSPDKDIVDEAVRYAEENNVLLVHAAGNDSKNIDEENNFPNKNYLDGSVASNWLEIGASSWGDETNFVASFSNYGQTQVDVFAPGVAIYSTIPDSGYTNHDGTSMAAPVVAGIAATLLSYYPELTAQDLKEIIMQSSIKYTDKVVNMPSDEDGETVSFGTLSVSGGIANLYEAVKLAESW